MSENINAIVEKRQGIMVAIASDDTLDRHGDSLSIDDWDFRNFKKNPVLQFAHNYEIPPIGLAKNIKKEDGRITFEPQFHEFTELARDIKKLYEEGIMKAFSVGFIPHTDKDEKSGEKKMRLELLEISAVPVPANPMALIIEKSLEKAVTQEEKEKIQVWAKAMTETVEVKEVVQQEILNVEEKVGKVLSKKNRGVIENAVKSLQELLEMDIPEEEPEQLQKEHLEQNLHSSLSEPDEKDLKQKKDKGRYQELIIKETLEALNSQVGFIARKLAKK